jgi:hypothetical protein
MFHRTRLGSWTTLLAICLLSVPAYAGYIELHATDAVSLEGANAGGVNPQAVRFDMSQLPEGIVIDLAEISFPVTVDTLRSHSAVIEGRPILEQWATLSPQQQERPQASDSLRTNVRVDVRYGTNAEAKLTRVVQGWYDGSLTNNGLLLETLGSNAEIVDLPTPNVGLIVLRVYFTRQAPGQE